jgi:hypothetical protein
VVFFLRIEYKGVEEKGAVNSPFREVAVGVSHRLELLMFVVSEPGGRKALLSRTSP